MCATRPVPDRPRRRGEDSIDRRTFLTAGAAAAGALTFGPGIVKAALAAPAKAGPGPYGALLAADANGVSCRRDSPRGSRRRLPVPGTRYLLPIFPDGQATFRTGDGGWILATNAESLAAVGSGASAIRFDRTARSATHTGSSATRTSTAPAARRRGAPGSRARNPTTA